MNWWMNVQQQNVNQNCVGMFTLVNPKDSSRPGRSRPGLNESVKNGISKGLLQPLGCRVVTASKHHQSERFGSYSDLSRPYCVLAWNLTSAKPVWPIFIVFISFRRPASRAHSLTWKRKKDSTVHIKHRITLSLSYLPPMVASWPPWFGTTSNLSQWHQTGLANWPQQRHPAALRGNPTKGSSCPVSTHHVRHYFWLDTTRPFNMTSKL